jgi:hypothetical protein
MVAEETKERILRAEDIPTVIELLTIVFSAMDELETPPEKILKFCKRLEMLLQKAKATTTDQKKLENIKTAILLINIHQKNMGAEEKPD